MTIARSTERSLQKEACDSGGPKGGTPYVRQDGGHHRWPGPGGILWNGLTLVRGVPEATGIRTTALAKTCKERKRQQIAPEEDTRRGGAAAARLASSRQARRRPAQTRSRCNCQGASRKRLFCVYEETFPDANGVVIIFMARLGHRHACNARIVSSLSPSHCHSSGQRGHQSLAAVLRPPRPNKFNIAPPN